MNNKKQHISVTSALVLLWTGNSIYKTREAKKYLSLLNLDEGHALLKQMDLICNWYDHVLKNRKYHILRMLDEQYCRDARAGVSGDSRSFNQVVILAAGINPLSLELASRYKNIKVFDLDIENMPIKKKLINKVSKKLSNRIHCIKADMTKRTQTFNLLKQKGFDPAKSTIVIVEGISYYLPKESLWNMINLFKTNNHKNFLIFEYLLKENLINKRSQEIPKKIFNLIAKQCKIKTIYKYNRSEIKKHLGNKNYKNLTFCNMKEMEQKRLNTNKHFPSQKDGWIEIGSCFII